jgi:hypothetical protein
MVGWDGPTRLDELLETTSIPTSFDLLSVDIDGNDYHVWAASERYSPRVVVVEFNPTIPNGISFVQPADPQVNQGSSLDALVELATRKGYELAGSTEFNAFFVRSDVSPRLGIADRSVAALRTDTSWQTQIFFGFDGHAFLRGGKALYWHGVPPPREIRVVPRPLEGFPGAFGPVRRTMLLVWRVWRYARARVGPRSS